MSNSFSASNFKPYRVRPSDPRTFEGWQRSRKFWSALKWCPRWKCRFNSYKPQDIIDTFLLQIMQKKQWRFFKGFLAPVANIFAKGTKSCISSVNTYPTPSDPLGKIGLGRPSLDHLYKLLFFWTSQRICPNVFRLPELLISVTSVREKPNAASACRLERGCCEKSPAEGSLPNNSVTVGKE